MVSRENFTLIRPKNFSFKGHFDWVSRLLNPIKVSFKRNYSLPSASLSHKNFLKIP